MAAYASKSKSKSLKTSRLQNKKHLGQPINTQVDFRV